MSPNDPLAAINHDTENVIDEELERGYAILTHHEIAALKSRHPANAMSCIVRQQSLEMRYNPRRVQQLRSYDSGDYAKERASAKTKTT